MVNIASKLFETGCIKFGEFVLNSGIKSPFYVDLRTLVSYPQLMNDISKAALMKIDKETDCVCGVPYGAVPLATNISSISGMPMLMLRKQLKDHGTPKLIEGRYDDGMSCLLIDDIIVSGKAILESIKILGDHGLKVKEVFVVIDREQGGSDALSTMGIKLTRLFTISQVFDLLKNDGLICGDTHTSLSTYIKENVVKFTAPCLGNLSFDERSNLATNLCAKRLFKIMHDKKTNLCFSADLDSLEEVITLVEIGGPYICLLKAHVDIYQDFSLEKISRLKELSITYNFMILEDRKFADIGFIAAKQHKQSLFKTSSWADIVTVHVVSGGDILDSVGDCLVIVEMSSKGTLATEGYKKGKEQIILSQLTFVLVATALAMSGHSNVVGFITQTKATGNPRYLNVTPGINFSDKEDSKGQQYTNPIKAVTCGSDIVVVGRGIYLSNNPLLEFKKYQHECFSAYSAKMSSKI